MTANPASPRESNDTTGAKIGYGIHDSGAGDEAALLRILDAAVIDDETTKSGAVAVSAHTDHDAVDVGGPVKVGGRAQDPTAQPDEVADNDRVDGLFDRNGRLAVWNGAPLTPVAIAASSSGDNTLVAAQAAGKRIAVHSYVIIAEGDVDVRFEDGAGGTALSGQMHMTADGAGISASGGFVPLLIGSAATLLNLELSGAVAVNGHMMISVIDD